MGEFVSGLLAISVVVLLVVAIIVGIAYLIHYLDRKDKIKDTAWMGGTVCKDRMGCGYRALYNGSFICPACGGKAEPFIPMRRKAGKLILRSEDEQ